MSTTSHNHSTQNTGSPFYILAALLFSSSVVNIVATIAFHLFSTILLTGIFWIATGATGVGIGWIFFILAIIHIYWAYESYEEVPTNRGWLIKILGVNTHFVVKTGYWSFILYPLISYEETEEISYEFTDIAVPKFRVNDKDDLGFDVEGIIKYQVEKDLDQSKFINTDFESFKKFMATEGRNAATTTVNKNHYSPKENPENSLLRDLRQFNDKILENMDTDHINEDYDVKVTKVLFTITPTAETLTTVAKPIDAKKTATATGAKITGLSLMIKQYMQDNNCSYEEAFTACNYIINPTENININSGKGGGQNIVLINPKGSSK